MKQWKRWIREDLKGLGLFLVLAGGLLYAILFWFGYHLTYDNTILPGGNFWLVGGEILLTGIVAAAVLAVGCTTLTAGAFTDTENHWAASAINKWSQEYGIIQGYDDGTFRPDNSITRGAFAGILDRFLHFQTTSPANTLSDTAGT